MVSIQIGKLFPAFVSAFLLSLSTAVSALTPDESHGRTYTEILTSLKEHHFRQQSIDDAFSERYLNQYLDTLDPGKAFFYKSDIDKLKRYKTTLDDAALAGDVSPGFEIFNLWLERASKRFEANIAMLESDSTFDFTVDESLVIDPDALTWPRNKAEADDLWRKRMKDALIRLLLADKPLEEAKETMVKRYRNQLAQLSQRDSEDVFQTYVNALTMLYDPHTSYMSPRTLDNFNISMSLSLEGIGAVLTFEDEYTKVVRIVPGGPADLQGELKAADRIVAVAQGSDEFVDVVGWRLDDVVQLIRGDKGTEVRLQILPDSGEKAGQLVELAIVRDQVKLEEQAAKSQIIEVPREGSSYRLGVIELPAFYLDFQAYARRDPAFKSSTKDVAKLLDELNEANVDGIVFDLRNNGGGSLIEATTLTDLFINPGPVVQIKHADNRVSRNHRAYQSAVYDGPMIVLINRLSASAAEIFAGALQDYGRALVVGSQSFGKGSVQVMVPLQSGQLKLTESKYYRVSGQSTQHRGVVPDIAFPSFYDEEDVGESSQDTALPWDDIHRVPFRRMADFTPLKPMLASLHDQRAANDPDFAFVAQQIRLSDQWSETKTLPLNLEARRAMKHDREVELFNLDNARRTLKGLTPYADLEQWRKQRGEEDEDAETDPVADEDEAGDIAKNIEEDDPMLFEAGEILVDQIRLSKSQQQRMAQRQD